ncbi:hypothetical protein BD560DRAFT_400583 [Blakeslea trispora]|nr:hypothetical protein BD560DRAFT_400583 [Blakeslea trispora]
MKSKKQTEDDAVYEVEKIVNHRHSTRDNKSIDYFIKWKDYDDSNNTWEREANIYSKGLISAYWSKQPYTADAFRNKTYLKKQERQQYIQKVQLSEIQAAPPTGYTWDDIEAVVNVFKTEPNIFFAEVKWPRLDVNTYIPTRIIKRYNPLKLIYFYESQIEFQVAFK